MSTEQFVITPNHPVQVGMVFLRGADYFRVLWISPDKTEMRVERVTDSSAALASQEKPA